MRKMHFSRPFLIWITSMKFLATVEAIAIVQSIGSARRACRAAMQAVASGADGHEIPYDG